MTRFGRERSLLAKPFLPVRSGPRHTGGCQDDGPACCSTYPAMRPSAHPGWVSHIATPLPYIAGPARLTLTRLKALKDVRQATQGVRHDEAKKRGVRLSKRRSAPLCQATHIANI